MAVRAIRSPKRRENVCLQGFQKDADGKGFAGLAFHRAIPSNIYYLIFFALPETYPGISERDEPWKDLL
jgi:hypothetical protein